MAKPKLGDIGTVAKEKYKRKHTLDSIMGGIRRTRGRKKKKSKK